MEDKRNILRDEKSFDYINIKNDKAQIFFHGKCIKILQGREYTKLQRVVDLEDSYQLQLFLAKVTGQFKHGNEKEAKRRKS